MSNDAEAALIDRDAAHLLHPLHSRSGHAGGKVWAGGEGAYLIDANGDRFIDGLSGLWNNTAGNGRIELIEAATRLTDWWSLEAELRAFAFQKRGELLYDLRDDDFLQVSLTRHL